MGLSLRFDPEQLDGDLADEDDVFGGIETEVLVALATDRRVSDAELTGGRPNRGYWADSVIADGEQLGSGLWLLEDAPVGEGTVARAEALMQEALAPIILSGRLVGFDAGVTVEGAHVVIAPVLHLPDGSTRKLGPLRVN